MSRLSLARKAIVYAVAPLYALFVLLLSLVLTGAGHGWGGALLGPPIGGVGRSNTERGLVAGLDFISSRGCTYRIRLVYRTPLLLARVERCPHLANPIVAPQVALSLWMARGRRSNISLSNR